MWSIMWGNMVLLLREVDTSGLSFEWSPLLVSKKHQRTDTLHACSQWDTGYCWFLLFSCGLKWWLCCSWLCCLGVRCLSRVACWDPANWWGQDGKAYPYRRTWPVLSLQSRKYTPTWAYLYAYAYISAYTVSVCVCTHLCIYTTWGYYGALQVYVTHLSCYFEWSWVNKSIMRWVDLEV